MKKLSELDKALLKVAREQEREQIKGRIINQQKPKK